MVDETNRWIRENRWSPSETESRLAIEKAFVDEKSTNSCFGWNQSTININWKLVTDTSIYWKMGWVMLMRSFGCRSRESNSALCISATEFDNWILAFGLMKVTISRRWLDASLVSKILSTRFASSDSLQLKRHLTIRGRLKLAAIGSGTFEWIRQSTWMQIRLICCDIWHALPIGRRSLSHVI